MSRVEMRVSGVSEAGRGRATLICALADLVADAGVTARLGGEQIALFYLREGGARRVYAIGNQDPIGGAPVLSRGIVGDVDGEPVVASPLYKQHFSLVTGRCVEDASVSVPVYRVLVSDGYVFLVR